MRSEEGGGLRKGTVGRGKKEGKKDAQKVLRSLVILQKSIPHTPPLVGVLRGNTIRGNTTRNSERKMAL